MRVTRIEELRLSRFPKLIYIYKGEGYILKKDVRPAHKQVLHPIMARAPCTKLCGSWRHYQCLKMIAVLSYSPTFAS